MLNCELWWLKWPVKVSRTFWYPLIAAFVKFMYRNRPR